MFAPVPAPVPSPAAKRKRKSSSNARHKDYVKRSPNCFLIFRSEVSSSPKWARLRKSAGVKQCNLSKLAGMLWDKMDEDEKRPYVEMQDQYASQHQLSNPDYVYSPKCRNSPRRRAARKLDKVRAVAIRNAVDLFAEAAALGHDSPTSILNDGATQVSLLNGTHSCPLLTCCQMMPPFDCDSLVVPPVFELYKSSSPAAQTFFPALDLQQNQVTPSGDDAPWLVSATPSLSSLLTTFDNYPACDLPAASPTLDAPRGDLNDPNALNTVAPSYATDQPSINLSDYLAPDIVAEMSSVDAPFASFSGYPSLDSTAA